MNEAKWMNSCTLHDAVCMYALLSLLLFPTFTVVSSLEIIKPTNFQVIKISENMDPGLVFRAVVLNPSYGQLKYRLQQSGTIFYLDGKDLMTNRKFDYEVIADRTHDLTLKVSNSYTTVECSFQIQVTDVNDNRPVLSGSFYGYAKEEQPVGQRVVFNSLSVVDDDSTDILRYSLSDVSLIDEMLIQIRSAYIVQHRNNRMELQ